MNSDMGLIGLGVMGRSLALNMDDHGIRTAVYNRTAGITHEFIKGPGRGTGIMPCYSLGELAKRLKRPRRIMLMVRSGDGVDSVIQGLIPLLDPGDIIIDGGNSLYTDTRRRYTYLSDRGIGFLGVGVSGGEQGARNGPSLMPGGDHGAWAGVRDVFERIAARVDNRPCCSLVGDDGAGHFIKMVHNGIEYGDMQLICEVYDFMSRGLGMEPDSIGGVFRSWNDGILNSYLLEISSEIISFKDGDGSPLIDKILDKAGQKGTGMWTVSDALDRGVPLTLISEAVFSRYLSVIKEERSMAAKMLHGPVTVNVPEKEEFIPLLHDALYASRIISYTQGYMLMKEASGEYGWDLDYSAITHLWRGGCIIRSRILDNIMEAFNRNPYLDNLLLDDFFMDAVHDSQNGWRRTAASAVETGIPAPAITSGISFYDGYRSERLPSNLLQAQRDYFGAHSYERVDSPGGGHFHTNWQS